MARPKKVDRLEPGIKRALADLREAGRTIDEIVTHLKSLGVEHVSRSAVGRWTQDLDAVAADMRASREFGNALASRLGDASDSTIGRLNIEMCQSAIFKLQRMAQSADAVLEPRDAAFLTKAIKDLIGAEKMVIDLRSAVRKELQADMKLAMDKALDDAAGEADKGAALARIRRDVYGIVDAA